MASSFWVGASYGLSALRFQTCCFFLSRMLGRSVIDKTGLTGKFDVTAEWTPDDPQAAAPLPPDAPKPPSGDVGPSIFTAFQEQLGLKLESQKGPVEILRD